MKKVIIIFLFLFLETANYTLLATKVHAQEVSLGIYPPIFQMNANRPPVNMTSPVSIQNFSNDPVTLEITMRQFTSSDKNSGEVKFFTNNNDIQNPDSNILKKIQILDKNQPIDQILLAPQEEKSLTLSVTLPKDEPPGDYYFSILFISKGKVINQKNASTTNMGIATNLLLSIGNKEKASGLLKEFSTPYFINHGPVVFTVLIQNSSNHYINPEGAIVIKNVFGQVVGKIDLLPVNILAHTARLIPDKSQSSDTQAIWKETFLVGPYTAELTTALSKDGPLFKKTIHFVAMPIPLIIALVFFCIVLAIIIVGVKYKLKNGSPLASDKNKSI
jgi:hypothetical protein